MSEQNKTKSPKAKTKQRRLKLSEGMIIALISLVGTIIASLLGSPLIGKWFVSTPILTTSATSTIPPTSQPTVQYQTLEPSPKPTEILDSTPTPSTIEITDAKGVEMVLVPEGDFIMGSDNGGSDEKPIHTVHLDSYYIDKYELTNALYKACVDTGACQPPQNNSSYTRASYYDNADFEDYPAIYVDWNMAKTYCEWRRAELPTEAQWEKAARGVAGRLYPWGDSFDGSIVNFCDLNCTFEWSNKNYDDRYADTAPVGSYPRGTSPYGIYDMAGNVFEWVADWYATSYGITSLDSIVVNPQGPSEGNERVMRSSSWYFTKPGIYSSYRNKSDPRDIYNDVGFRCARDANP